MSNFNVPLRQCMLVACVSALAACATMGDDYPAVSDDGLQRMDRSGFDAFYLDADDSLAGYTKILLEDARVEFREDWLRDQNIQRRGVRRVDEKDMQRIREMVAQEFDEAFRKELSEDGRYRLVDAAASDVLVLRPVIVDLDIRAPDVMAPIRESDFVTSVGEMTLELEFYAAGDTLLGRVIDRGRDFDDNVVERASSVKNRFETARIMRRWAADLRRVLESSRS